MGKNLHKTSEYSCRAAAHLSACKRWLSRQLHKEEVRSDAEVLAEFQGLTLQIDAEPATVNDLVEQARAKLMSKPVTDDIVSTRATGVIRFRETEEESSHLLVVERTAAEYYNALSATQERVLANMAEQTRQLHMMAANQPTKANTPSTVLVAARPLVIPRSDQAPASTAELMGALDEFLQSQPNLTSEDAELIRDYMQDHPGLLGLLVTDDDTISVKLVGKLGEPRSIEVNYKRHYSAVNS